MKFLVTGACGFIGYNLSIKLLEQKNTVIGVDNLDSYYSVKLKKDRLRNLKKYNDFLDKRDFGTLLLYTHSKLLPNLYCTPNWLCTSRALLIFACALAIMKSTIW